MKNSLILVTGGTGFLGAYIIRELLQTGHRVRAIRRKPKLPFFIAPSQIERAEWMTCDILDPAGLEEAMRGVDSVVHAAAKVSFDPSEKKEMFKINIEGTANVVNTALALGIERLLYVSSVSALGRTGRGELISEGEQWEEFYPNTNYSLSKYQAEMEVWRALGEGLNAVIVNPSTILGYGDWNESSCAIFKNVFMDFPWYTNGINGFVDVQDVARAVLLLLESDVTAERFVLNGDNWSFRQVFNSIADGFSKKHPTREASPLLGEIVWRLEKIKSMLTGKPSLLTRETARFAQGKNYFDNRKMLRYFPEFQFSPLQKTIQRACEAYLHPIPSAVL